MLKKILLGISGLVMVFALAGVVHACPKYQYVTNWADTTHVEYIDIGNAESEEGFVLEGWGTPQDWQIKYYGGHTGDLKTVWGLGTCTPETKYASVTLPDMPLSMTVNSVKIRHLDGEADDSFDVYINDVLVGSYQGEEKNMWQETTFGVNGQYAKSEAITIKLEATAAPWGGCSGWGQVAIDWMEVTMNGYSE